MAAKIHNENLNINDNKIFINLGGIAIGNGWMSPEHQGRYADFLKNHGLIDHKQYQDLDKLDLDLVSKVQEMKWREAWQFSDTQLNFILTALNYSNLYDYTQDQYRPSSMNFWYWMSQPQVRKALHVGTQHFSDGLDIYMSMVGDTMTSSVPELMLTLENYKVLAFHGALDIICHYPGADLLFSNSNWTRKGEYEAAERKSWWVWNDNTQVHELGGYVKTGGNLSLMLIRNAGHSVPVKQPLWALRKLFNKIKVYLKCHT